MQTTKTTTLCTQLYTTLHNPTQLYNTLRNSTRLYNISQNFHNILHFWHNFTQTLQHCTTLFKIIRTHNFTQLFNSCTIFLNIYNTLQPNQEMVKYFTTLHNTSQTIYKLVHKRILYNSTALQHFTHFNILHKIYNTFTELYKGLHTLHKTLHRFTQRTLYKIVQHFKHYKHIPNYTKLCQTLHVFTKLFETLQDSTQLYTTLHNFTELYTTLQNFAQLFETTTCPQFAKTL